MAINDINNEIVNTISTIAQTKAQIQELMASRPDGNILDILAQPELLEHLDDYLYALVEMKGSITTCRFPEGLKIIPTQCCIGSSATELEIPESIEVASAYAFSMMSLRRVMIKGIPQSIGESFINLSVRYGEACHIHCPKMTLAQLRAYPNYPFHINNGSGNVIYYCSDGEDEW